MQIAQLQGTSTPAIMQNYETARKYAETVTEEKQQLEGKISVLKHQVENSESILSIQRLMSESTGFGISRLVLQRYLGEVLFSGKDARQSTIKDIETGFIAAYDTLTASIKERNEKVELIFEPINKGL